MTTLALNNFYKCDLLMYLSKSWFEIWKKNFNVSIDVNILTCLNIETITQWWIFSKWDCYQISSGFWAPFIFRGKRWPQQAAYIYITASKHSQKFWIGSCMFSFVDVDRALFLQATYLPDINVFLEINFKKISWIILAIT